MKRIHIFVVLSALFLLSGCYPTIKGKVVDGATGKPIEGALVVVQWTKERIFPEPVRTLYKIVETQTDKEGNFTISGVNDPFVKPPEMIIYKDGYVPWSNVSIFPSTNIVKDYEWKNNITYTLSEFDNKYTIEQLKYFMNASIMIDALDKVPKYDRMRSKINDTYYNN